MKQNNNRPNRNTPDLHDIPDIEIMDLESDGNLDDTRNSSRNNGHGKGNIGYSPELEYDNDTYEDYEEYDEEASSEDVDSATPAGFRRFLNPHIIFAVLLVIVVGVVAFRLTHWGKRVDQSEIFKDGQGSYDDSLDSILPLTDANGQMVNNESSTIVVFGNAPFADDRGDKNNLASLIEKETGATVYNCSISGSYLAAQNYSYDPETAPMDAYCLYWLVNMAAGVKNDYYQKAGEALGDATPPEADEVYDILTTLDFNTVDTIAIMYDATDYLMGNPMYSDENATDPTQFTGNLEASLDVLQSTYPNIRIIVMSPAYAYAVDENGDYISSDMYIYNDRDVLSTYVIRECYSSNMHSVSFLDNLYGTITEDNAKDYLIDNLHLNVDGRKLIAKRFEYFLNYYAKDYASQAK